MSNKRTKKAIILGLGAAAAYSIIKGDGIFNKPRFYNQYKATKKYLSGLYPDAVIGKIVKTSGGWSAVITTPDKVFLLSLSKSPDGAYIFNETSM